MIGHLLCCTVKPPEISGTTATGFFLTLRHLDQDDILNLACFYLNRRATIPCDRIDPAFHIIGQLLATYSPVISDTQKNHPTPSICKDNNVFINPRRKTLFKFNSEPLTFLYKYFYSIDIRH